MGLGKTVLSIAAAESLIDAGEAGGGLVIAPASLKRQWAKQIDAFTGGANVGLVDGDRRQRGRVYDLSVAGKLEYVILNYEQVVNDWDIVRHLPRDFVVIDEATAIKNPGTKRTKAVKRLKAKWRWALTGQPVENRAEEVFSIMQWVDPDVLGPAAIFDRTFIVRDSYGKPVRYRNLPLLFKTLSRSMVRKTWADPDVADQMPKVSEESILVDFDPAGAKLYRLMMSDLLDALEESQTWGDFDLATHYGGGTGEVGEDMQALGDVMSRLVCARMLCDHPELLRLSAARHRAGEDDRGSIYAQYLDDAGHLDGVKRSPKLDAVVELVSEILSASPRNKVVLFSFFKDFLALVAEATAGITDSAMFHGDLSQAERDDEKVRFQTDPNTRLFLSSDAGGYGVDLPQANYLVSADLPWSAGAWRQRNARIIRLSSEFDHVTLVSVLMSGSIEERQYESLTLKQSAADAIVDGRGFGTEGILRLDRDSLAEFVRNSTV